MGGEIMISNYDRNHIYEILCGRGDWFGAQLIRLVEKADAENRAKIAQSFPEYVEAYNDWYCKRGVYEGREDR
jgi:hypothetical protein